MLPWRPAGGLEALGGFEAEESVYALSADIKAAHRLVKIREEDWPLLGCKVRSEDKTVWINTVGTFGISSASYWWSRLFSGGWSRGWICVESARLASTGLCGRPPPFVFGGAQVSQPLGCNLDV